MSRPLIAALAAAASLAVFVPAAGAAPARPLMLGTADPGYASSDASHRDRVLDATVGAKAGVVRISAFWFAIAPTEPLPLTDRTDPRNPAYDWERLDAAVRDAKSRGLEVILTLQRAPRWAEGPDEPAGLAQGVWKPDPVAFGDFAQAVATRYSGDFAPNPLQPTVKLPRVRYYQAWNEANLRNHLMPQYEGATPVSVEMYRDLLNEAYDGINAADSSATVVAAGTAPLQSNTATDRTGPLTFWRKLLCLSAGLQATPCPGGEKAKFDVFDHHPITFRDPDVPGTGDSVLISDFDDLTEVWRAAESRGTVAPGRRPMWTTEIYWETNPPEVGPGAVSPSKAAEYLQRAIRSLYLDGVGFSSTSSWSTRTSRPASTTARAACSTTTSARSRPTPPSASRS